MTAPEVALRIVTDWSAAYVPAGGLNDGVEADCGVVSLGAAGCRDVSFGAVELEVFAVVELDVAFGDVVDVV